FGDYFKPEAIPMAWELVTEVLGIDPDQLWVTVHTTDDEAEQIWLDAVGIDPTRIQRLGADNWWGPPGGPPGPCGPCTEIYVDKGPRYGADGGPAHGGEERFLEIWNLVFMQFNRDADGVDHELPRKNIDTGAGLERILGVLQGVDDVYEIDEFVPIVDEAQRLTGHRLGADAAADVSLRILAEHARTVAFLVSDGVFPSNNGRGYVLRRILRRAVRHAFLLGVEDLVTPELIGTVAQVMGDAYPDLRANVDFVQSVVGREEESFRRTLRQGLAILDSELADVGAGGSLGGSVAFTLHDTHGFPLELTEEIAAEHDVAVDRDGFEAEMQAQRSRAKADRAAKGGGVDLEPYLDVLEQFGATEFTGRQEDESKARVLAVVPVDADASDETSHWVVLDRTPFYAESGGQVGDTGTIRAGDLVVDVTDTTYAVPGQLIRHAVRLDGAALAPGAEVVAAIDADRRAAIRRNHTATHLLHWALREVLGDHVKQQGSLVAPDRLRFDFSHYEAVTPEQLARIEDLVNGDVLANSPTRHFETTMDAAQQLGAIAFFGDKYGDIVRVLEAGPHSTELCGGTHVHALGDIGAVKVISEASIGSNIRRLEAVTGFGPIERLRQDEQRLSAIADVLGVGVDEAVLAVERRNAEVKELQRELRTLRQRLAATQATELAATAVDGVVVARVDGTSRDDLRDLALAVRDVAGIRAAVLGGAPDGGGAALVAAVAPGADLDAGALIADAAKAIKGGGGRNPDLAIAGGKDPAGLDEALAQVRAVAGR
ncbi:MAG: alanine--tRNA ligase, partial [Acidimicrobiales bacterium]|nr:alanine--tRNA ligase [Acidimicrobiales bacterium]